MQRESHQTRNLIKTESKSSRLLGFVLPRKLCLNGLESSRVHEKYPWLHQRTQRLYPLYVQDSAFCVVRNTSVQSRIVALIWVSLISKYNHFLVNLHSFFKYLTQRLFYSILFSFICLKKVVWRLSGCRMNLKSIKHVLAGTEWHIKSHFRLNLSTYINILSVIKWDR